MKPDYDNSIVNLMSSIGRHFNFKSDYKPLDIDIKGKNVVLLIIDGLGYNFLNKHKNSFLRKHLKKKITSVFPSTTASAITSFHTGDAPLQHGIVGWFTYLKELGVIATILRMNPMYGGETFRSAGIYRKHLFDVPEFYEKIKSSFYYIMPDEIVFDKRDVGRKHTRTYNTKNQFFSQIKRSVQAHKKKKYIYAYWPHLDGTCHFNGPKSKEAKKHFLMIDRDIKKLAKSLEKSNTTLIVTADHGFVDVPKNKYIELGDHPKFLDTLSVLPSGDIRVKYCFVRLNKEKEFLSYVKKNFNKFCTVHKSTDLVKDGWFGKFKPHPHFFDRVGDYTLIMKENYVFRDPLLNKAMFLKGHHSGVSEDEMFVPLIKFEL